MPLWSLAKAWFFVCWKRKNWFKAEHRPRNRPGIAVVEKGRHVAWIKRWSWTVSTVSTDLFHDWMLAERTVSLIRFPNSNPAYTVLMLRNAPKSIPLNPNVLHYVDFQANQNRILRAKHLPSASSLLTPRTDLIINYKKQPLLPLYEYFCCKWADTKCISRRQSRIHKIILLNYKMHSCLRLTFVAVDVLLSLLWIHP